MIHFGEGQLTRWFDYKTEKPVREGWYLVYGLTDDLAHYYTATTRGPKGIVLPGDCEWRYWHSTKGWMWCDADGVWHGATVVSPWRGLLETFPFKAAELRTRLDSV